MVRAVVWLALVACAPEEGDPPPASPAVLGDPDPARLVETLDALMAVATAHDGHRAAGSAGYAASVDFVEQALLDLGLEVTRAPWELVDESLADTPRVEIAGRMAEYGEDFLVAGGSGSASLFAPAVGVDVLDDPPGSTSGCEASDFEGFPAGAVAVVQRGTCAFSDKIANAAAAGAVAVILFNEGDDDRRGLFEPSIGEVADDLPVLAATTAFGREVIAAGEVALHVQVTRTVVVQDNLVARLPGTTGRTWMIGAHLDSVPAGPGINDNGTGVASILETARLLLEVPTRGDGVDSAFWGGEELGLLGSLAWVSAADAATLTSLRGYLNLDMVGSPNPAHLIYDGDGSTFGEGGPRGSAVIEEAYAAVYDDAGAPWGETALDGRSDYLGFMLADVPSGGLFTGAESPKSRADAERFGGEAGEPYDPCYHRACDTVDNVDLDALVTATRANLRALDALRASGDTTGRATPRPPGWTLDLPVAAAAGCAAHAPLTR